jgi:Glycosyl transferases group 1
VMPGEEDFGMTMVESLASGKPVIALGSGGALDIVGNGCGVLYAEPNEACLEDALRAFDRVEALIHPVQLKVHAAEFSEAVFERRFRAVVHRSRTGDSPENAHTAPIVTLRAGASEKFQARMEHAGGRGWHLPAREPAE